MMYKRLEEAEIRSPSGNELMDGARIVIETYSPYRNKYTGYCSKSAPVDDCYRILAGDPLALSANYLRKITETN